LAKRRELRGWKPHPHASQRQAECKITENWRFSVVFLAFFVASNFFFNVRRRRLSMGSMFYLRAFASPREISGCNELRPARGMFANSGAGL
jgi:hypothetical protein